MVGQRSLRPSADMNAAGLGADMVSELTPWLVRVLALHGYDTVEKLREASDAELREILGVERIDLQRIREVVG